MQICVKIYFMSLPQYFSELSREKLSVDPEVNRLSAESLIELLGHSDLTDNIKSGNVTLAMIRPSLETSVTNEGSDTELANEIEENIVGLGMMAKFAICFDEKAINSFYEGDPKAIQLQQKPIRLQESETRWDEFVHIMTSGPTTVLLLYTPEGDAIQKWREQVGHWNIEANRDPATLRGRFGRDNFNNLIHGSDARDSVLREKEIIRDCLIRQS